MSSIQRCDFFYSKLLTLNLLQKAFNGWIEFSLYNTISIARAISQGGLQNEKSDLKQNTYKFYREVNNGEIAINNNILISINKIMKPLFLSFSNFEKKYLCNSNGDKGCLLCVLTPSSIVGFLFQPTFMTREISVKNSKSFN